MKQFLRDCFSFNRRERNGVVVLLAIITALLGFLAYQHVSVPSESLNDILKEEAVVDSEIPPPRASKLTLPEYFSKKEGSVEHKPDYFMFNPNTLSFADWRKLGLSEKQAGIIRNYVGKGGKFRKPEDLRKIYGLHPDQEAALEPWVRIPADSTRKKIEKVAEAIPATSLPSRKLRAGEQLELNSADSEALLRLPCIGPSFAKRILAYRARLGGYVSPSQLMEVFGMDEERFNCMGAQVMVDANAVRKIPVNTATVDELRKHPYIPWKLANLIVNYRKLHGPFQTAEDLGKLELMNEVLLQKLAPYISVK
jgi:competence protein ComEA